MTFVVTGTGHSGTAWLSLAFSYLGVATTHEGVYTLRGVHPWPPGLVGDVSLAAAPHLETLPPGTRALIVVRNPLEVVDSFYRGRNFARTCPCHELGAHLGSPFVRYVFDHVDIHEDGDELGTTIRYVDAWHRLAAPYAPVARLEDLVDNELAAWAHYLAGVDPQRTEDLLAGPWLTKDVNAHGPLGDIRPPLTWQAIDEHPDGVLLRRLALDLGYL